MLPIQGLALERNESARSDPQHKGSLQEPLGDIKVDIDFKKSPSRNHSTSEADSVKEEKSGARKKTAFNLDKIDEGDD